MTSNPSQPGRTRRAVSMVLACVACALACLGATACGLGGSSSHPASTTSKTASASHEAPDHRYLLGDYDDDDGGYYPVTSGDKDSDDSHGPTDGDGDFDSRGKSRYDADDSPIRDFGHPADPADARAIATLVKRYYVAVVADNGASACSMIVPSLARAFTEDLGQAGPAYLHASTTCPELLSRLFKQNQRQLHAYGATLRVAGVRLKGELGLALLAFKGLPMREIDVMRAHGAWKLYAVLDNELP